MPMITTGSDDKIYPVVKLAAVIDALAAEGISAEDALSGVRISKSAVSSPATRVSLNQVIECYRNADQRSQDPHFAYHAGLQFHVATYGMYGFAILSSMNYRQTMDFAMKYHQLATPTTEIDFTESGGYGIWKFRPVPHSRVDARLYRFIVEMQFGITLSLLRDVMGPSFAAREFRVTYERPTMRRNIQASLDAPCCSANPKTALSSMAPGSMAHRSLETKLPMPQWSGYATA